MMKHYIIPIFIPYLGCPQQCVFCNQQKITGLSTPVTAEHVAAIIDERLAVINQDRHVEVAFYGGSFTALPETIQNDLLAPATQAFKHDLIQGIRLSTRPDCLGRSMVGNLVKQKVTTVEIGVQSLDDDVLARAGRGHDSQTVVRAVAGVKAAGLKCGLQLMPGLPGEDWSSLISTARHAADLNPDFIRIYPTVVIAGTTLACLYEKGAYKPLSLPQGIARAAYMKLVFERKGIAVIRTGLQAAEELDRPDTVLAGPYHPAFGELVDSYIFYLMVAGFIEQNFLYDKPSLVIGHHPHDCSKVRGQHNGNLNNLKEQYPLTDIRLSSDLTVKKGSLLFEVDGQKCPINKDMINMI